MGIIENGFQIGKPYCSKEEKMAIYEINWARLSEGLRGEDKSRCANPFCDRVAGDGHAFCPRCRAHGIFSLEALVAGFVAGRRGKKLEMPSTSNVFFARILDVAAEQGLIPASYAEMARGYHTTLENLADRIALLWFNVQMHQEALARAREDSIVAEAAASATEAISNAEMQAADVAEVLGEAAAMATMVALKANHPECFPPHRCAFPYCEETEGLREFDTHGTAEAEHMHGKYFCSVHRFFAIWALKVLQGYRRCPNAEKQFHDGGRSCQGWVAPDRRLADGTVVHFDYCAVCNTLGRDGAVVSGEGVTDVGQVANTSATLAPEGQLAPAMISNAITA